MYFRANQFPQSISLTTKTSVHPNLVVPPNSGEKPIKKVREAGKAFLQVFFLSFLGFEDPT